MHLTLELALDLIEGRIDSSEIQPLTEHVDSCSGCSQQLKDWRRVHSRLGALHLKNAPLGFVEDARTIFDARPVPTRPIFREIAAATIFDSFVQPAFAGARGAIDSRQLVLRAEALDIHLKISTNPSQQQIIGQVFVRNESQFLSSVRVHLLQERKPFKSIWSDNFGGFQFDNVPQGVFHLQIDLPQLTVVGGISIGEQTPRTRQGGTET